MLGDKVCCGARVRGIAQTRIEEHNWRGERTPTKKSLTGIIRWFGSWTHWGLVCRGEYGHWAEESTRPTKIQHGCFALSDTDLFLYGVLLRVLCCNQVRASWNVDEDPWSFNVRSRNLKREWTIKLFDGQGNL